MKAVRNIALLMILGCASLFFIPEAYDMLGFRARAQRGADVATEGSKLGYFDYADPEHDMTARIYLPESLGGWNIENPWRDSTKSLIREPQLFVKVNFQSVNYLALYGLIRVVFDLHGADCGTLFTKLAKADGLALEKSVASEIGGVKAGRLYLFEYSHKAKNLVVVSKVLCDDKSAMELMLISPDDAKFASAISTMLATAEMHIPATASN